MESFRIIHISDMHISGTHIGHKNDLRSISDIINYNTLKLIFKGDWKKFYPSSFDKDIAVKALYYITDDIKADNKQTLDAIIVSGDLATTGHDVDLTMAKRFFLGDIPTKWIVEQYPIPALTDSNLPILIIPGNHDRFRTDTKWLFPGNHNFEKHFEQNWCIKPLQGNCDIKDASSKYPIKFARIQKGNECIRFYLIDLCLTSSRHSTNKLKGGYLGQGRAYPRLINSLKKHIINLQSDNKYNRDAIIWVTHFPPNAPSEKGDETLKLLLEERLLQAATECKISAILAGHIHKQKRFTITDNNHSVEVICAGSMCSVDIDNSGNQLWDVVIDVEHGITKNIDPLAIIYNKLDAEFTETISD